MAARAEPSPASRPDPGAAALFGCFAGLLAAALLAHQLWWNGFEVRSLHFAVVLAALWTIGRPTSVVAFLVMLAAEAVSVGLEMPAVHSHKLLGLVLAVAVLAYAAVTIARTRRLPGPGELFTAVAPFLRLGLLVVYGSAAVSKLNSGFFDPATSCAVAMSARISWFDPSLLDGAVPAAAAIWATVLVELALPVLLAVPRTRLAGLALGAGFHAVLALAGNVPFSALVLAFYVAFLPAGAPARVLAATSSHAGLVASAGRVRRLAGSRGAFALMAGAWLAAAAGLDGERALAAALIGDGTRIAFVVAVLAAAAVLVAAFARGGPSVPPARSPRPLHPVFAAGLAILVLNSLSPYLGFKTESSFTMFSGLQTEAGQWNHRVIPEAVRVLPYQDDLVRVVASSDPRLARRGRNGRLLVRYELERYLRLRPDARATVAPASRPGAGSRAAASAPATSLGTRIVDRVAKFRDVRPPGRRGC